MPYIKKTDRKEFNDILNNLDYFNLDAGKINYLVSSILKKFVSVHGENYSIYNEIIGALECIKLEMYRRNVASYEDNKIGENGDI